MSHLIEGMSIRGAPREPGETAATPGVTRRAARKFPQTRRALSRVALAPAQRHATLRHLMTALEIVQRRLRNQKLTRSEFRKPADVVAWLGAVQPQEDAAAKW